MAWLAVMRQANVANSVTRILTVSVSYLGRQRELACPFRNLELVTYFLRIVSFALSEDGHVSLSDGGGQLPLPLFSFHRFLQQQNTHTQQQ